MIAENRRKVPLVGRSGRVEAAGEVPSVPAKALRHGAQLAEPRVLAARAHCAVRGQHLLNQRRAGTRRAQDEDRLRQVAARGRARYPRHRRGAEVLAHRAVEGSYARGVVGKATQLGRELALAFDVVGPGLDMTADALVEAPPLELPFTVDVVGRLDDRERLGVAPGPGKELHAQQVDRLGGGRRLRGVEEPLRAGEVALHLPELRPVREDPEGPRREPVRLREGRLRLGGASLLHQVEREVRKRPRVRPAGLERAPEVPFTRRKVVFHGQQAAQLVVRERIFGIGDDGAARDDERIRAAAVIRQQGDEIDEGPVSAAIACNDVGQCLRGPRHVPARNRIAHSRGCQFNRLGHLLRVPPGRMT